MNTRTATDAVRGSARALALAALLVIVSNEVLDRSGWPAAVLTGHPDSMTRYESLRAQVAAEGASDVVVIGAAMIHGGVIPSVVAEELSRQRDGALVRVFNFGIAGHNALTFPMLVELVLAVDRPRAFVFRISPRATDSTAAENNRWADIVLESAYAKALLDPLPPRGRIARWLLDHAALRNRAPHLRLRLIGEGALPERASGAMDPERGYRSREPRVLNQRMRDHQRAIVRDWRTAPAYADALDTAIGAAQSAGARVLLVAAPQRSALLELMASPERNLQGGRRTFQAAAERTGAASAFVPPDLVSDRDFADYTHLLPEAAAVYSHWLAGAIARELPDF